MVKVEYKVKQERDDRWELLPVLITMAIDSKRQFNQLKRAYAIGKELAYGMNAIEVQFTFPDNWSNSFCPGPRFGES